MKFIDFFSGIGGYGVVDKWIAETDDDIDGVVAWMELPQYKEE